MKVVAFVQARLGSTRLPGKVLLDLAGEPMLARVMERLGRSKTLDEVVVVTSDLERDDPLVDLCEDRDWLVGRGSEQDVLQRFHKVAEERKPDVVVRVTSDCPLIDPEVVDLVVNRLLDERADYAANVVEPRTWPRGLDVEAFTFQALGRALDT